MHFPPMHDRVVVPHEGGIRPRNFAFPHEVIDDPSLSFVEKRAILSEWASDRSAVESFPTLRLLPGTTLPVTYSSIMDARHRLDDIAMDLEDGGEEEQLGRVVIANFARGRREGAPQ
jgi:hypothetical protein